MRDDEEYGYPLDVKVLGLVGHRICNLYTGKEPIFKEEITQENFSIPAQFGEQLSDLLKSCLALNPVDRPVLAELAIHPLFREHITLKSGYREETLEENRLLPKDIRVYDGFLIDEKTFVGTRTRYIRRKSEAPRDISTSIFVDEFIIG